MSIDYDIESHEAGDQADDFYIICPHCGWSFQAKPCDGDADETPQYRECDRCGGGFQSWAEISITYHTSAKQKSE